MNVPAEAQSLRMNWTREFEEELWSFVQSRSRVDPVSRSLKRFAEEKGVSVHTARAKYYQLKRKKESVVDNGSFGEDTSGGTSLRSWTQEDDNLLLETVEKLGAKPRSLSRAFEEAAQILNRTPVAVRARYYRLSGWRSALRRPIRSVQPEAWVEKEDRLLEGLSEFLENARSMGELNLTGFLLGLARLANLAKRGAEASGLVEKMRELEVENQELKTTIRAYEEKFERLRDEYRTLDFLVSEFINLGSIDKVTSLGDFGRRLRYQVDQFGLVVNVERA